MPSSTYPVFTQYAPGAKTPFVALSPLPILARQAPLGNNNAEPGTLWIELENNVNALVNGIWINTGKYAGVNQWINISGGNGNFSNIALPYTTASVGRFTYDGILTFNVPGPTDIYIGQGAGNVTATGVDNTSLGTSTLAALTTGHDNTAVGYEALQNDTTGNDNSAFGSLALHDLTTGSTNTALGYNSLSALLTGSGNTAIGSGSGSAYVLAESGNVLINDPGTIGDTNMLRITSSGAGQITMTGSTSGLLLQTNGLVEVAAVLTSTASPAAGTTANQRVVRMAYTGFTTAAAGTQSFTFTSSFITVASMIMVTVCNLNTSGNGAIMGLEGVQQAAGSMIIHTVNNGGGALGAGDTVFINVWILD